MRPLGASARLWTLYGIYGSQIKNWHGACYKARVEVDFYTTMPLVTHILESQDKPDALWHDPVPLQDVQSEKPWHRLAILLAAQGCTVTEIAEKLERTVPWVSLLLRQPWARERLSQEINRAGRDEIETLLRANGVEALRRVFALGEEAENESVKLAANREILDRLLGKPVQKVEAKQEVRLDVENIDRELKALEEQERLLTGTRVSAGSMTLVTIPLSQSEVGEKEGARLASGGKESLAEKVVAPQGTQVIPTTLP